MTLPRFTLLVTLAVGVGWVGQARSVVEPDLERGEVLYDLCGQCHGTEGEGSEPGLTRSCRILERHGGELRIESEPGRGTRVTACIPLD